MAAIARLQVGSPPIIAGDHTSTERRTATAFHLPGHNRSECIIEGQFFTSSDVPPRNLGQRIRKPEIWVAGVIAVAQGIISILKKV